MKVASRSIPIPVEADIDQIIKDGAAQTGLSQADIIRSGLRRGVPAFVRDALEAQGRRRKISWAWLDKLPRSYVAAKDGKAFLKEKLRAKYGVHR